MSKTMKSVNPVTGSTVATYDVMDERLVDELIGRTHRAQAAWRDVPLSERAHAMRRAAGVLREHRKRFADLMAEEMGKPLDQGHGEIDKCAWVCEYYADHAADFLAAESLESDGRRASLVYRPLGVVLAVMPWNFPFWQVFRFAAPSLMAGNGALLKHASNVCGTALAIETVLSDAGFPGDLFNTLLIGSDRVSGVIEDPRISAVTLTGSVAAGRAVASAAGGALKKTVLELGGSDPYVILEDADLDHAAEVCVKSRLINSGQSCIAAKRFVVVEAVRDAFENKMVALMKAKQVGDPRAEGTEVGPQARHDLRDDLHGQVERSISKGARCLLGGEIPDGEGAFYPPTVLTDVAPGMPAYSEELFGPVASIITAASEEEALHIANDTHFGLGAAVFTSDLERGERIAADGLEAGCCFVNALVKSDPRMPFGGVKSSGYGRELGRLGIREFVNAKTVYVA